MSLAKLIEILYKKGLGELYVLHCTQLVPVLGHIAYEKGKLVLKDSKLLSEFKAAQFKPCWESGMLGVIADSKEKPWESLTFYGLEECDMPVDLSKTRHNILIAAENQYGDSLVNFLGSIYRGYQLMMDNHFLPVILLHEAKTKNGEIGLKVCDLRSAPMPISLINHIYDEVRKSIDRKLILQIDEEVSIDEQQFKEIFKNYLNQ